MVKRHQSRIILFAVFAGVISLNLLFWMHSRYLRAQWGNVPPAPTLQQAAMSSLGDNQLAYRSTAMMLQNLGSEGGDVQPLSNYDYAALNKWFFLSSELDERSNAVPHLAAYYYGSGQDTEKVRDIMPYLFHVGSLPYPNKWMWMAHGAYIARHRIKDQEMALKFADALALLDDINIPIWARQMRAFVRYDQGEKQAAYDILKQMLLSGLDTLPPQEINAMRAYICDKILDEVAATKDPLCQK